MFYQLSYTLELNQSNYTLELNQLNSVISQITVVVIILVKPEIHRQGQGNLEALRYA